MESVKELRELSVKELVERILDLRKKEMEERLRTAGQAAKDIHLKRKIRRAVAQVKTIIAEKEAAQ